MNEISEVAESQKFQDDGEFLPAPEESGGSVTGAAIAGVGDPTVRVGHFRWVICALLFFAATVNYIDRQIIGILKPTLVKEFQWQDERIYAAIVFSFQLAYAIGLLLAGRVVDRIGIRRGF